MGLVSIIQSKQKGYALVLVLWFISLLSVMAGIVANSARSEVQLTGAQRSQLSGRLLTESGIWLVVNKLIANNVINQNAAGDFTESISIDGTTVIVSSQDLSGMININHAPPDLLHVLFSSTSLDSSSITLIMETLNSQKSLVSVDELRLIPGMTDIAYRKIAPYLTIFGQHEQINLLSANSDLLQLITSLASHEISDLKSLLKEGENTSQYSSINQRLFTVTRTNTFVINSQASLNGSLFKHSAIVEITARRRAEPYRILAWNPVNTTSGLTSTL